MCLGSRNWITQFLTILSEIPATFEYIDLGLGLSAPAIGFMQVLHGIFCRFMALPWRLCAGTPLNPFRSMVVPPVFSGYYSQFGPHAD